MNFTSLVFFIYLPVVVALYHLLPKPLKNVMLLLASYTFYAWYNFWLLGLLLATTLISYSCARAVSSAESKKKKKTAMVLAATVCLGTLFLFKYLDFTVETALSIANLFGAEISYGGINLILPMGISFYTFQTMSYVFDVYNGTFKAEKSILDYALFVVFFPQLVAGPIERPSDLLPQLKNYKKPDSSQIADGAKFLISGYAKKLFIADFLAVYVNSAYKDVSSSNGLALLIATVLFGLQIYCDFSGYSEIALGCGKLMGINLSKNFNSPYSATNIRDFWRRWHISLTKWFTDYLYIPLGGNRKGFFRTIINTLAVFTVSGLWHGANMTFVIWGLLHGAYLSLYSIWIRIKEKRAISLSPFIEKHGGRAFTIVLVTFSWIFFRSQSLNEAGIVIGNIFSNWSGGFEGALTSLSMTASDLLPVCLSAAILPFLERTPVFKEEALPLSRAKRSVSVPMLYTVICLTAVIAWSLTLSVNGKTAFIYFVF